MVGGSGASAKENKPISQGVAECKQWCDTHNKTVAGQHACYVNCEKYWGCNGSDSTAQTCADARNLAVEPGGGSGPTNPTFNPNLLQSVPKPNRNVSP